MARRDVTVSPSKTPGSTASTSPARPGRPYATPSAWGCPRGARAPTISPRVCPRGPLPVQRLDAAVVPVRRIRSWSALPLPMPGDSGPGTPCLPCVRGPPSGRQGLVRSPDPLATESCRTTRPRRAVRRMFRSIGPQLPSFAQIVQDFAIRSRIGIDRGRDRALAHVSSAATVVAPVRGWPPRGIPDGRRRGGIVTVLPAPAVG